MAKITSEKTIENLLLTLHKDYGYDISLNTSKRMFDSVQNDGTPVVDFRTKYDVYIWASYIYTPSSNSNKKKKSSSKPLKSREVNYTKEQYTFSSKQKMSLFLIELLNKAQLELGQAT